LINYLKSSGRWEDGTLEYEFGAFENIDTPKSTKYPTVFQREFISTPKEHLNVSMATNAGYLWDTTQKDALEKGNLIHLLMSKIYTKADIEITLNDFFNAGVISLTQSEELLSTLNTIVSHPLLAPYYSSDVEVYNEKEIMTSSGKIIIPDRLVIFNDLTAVVIDYKTGDPYDKYEAQLANYSEIIEEMGYRVIKKILVYINASLQVKVC